MAAMAVAAMRAAITIFTAKNSLGHGDRDLRPRRTPPADGKTAFDLRMRPGPCGEIALALPKRKVAALAHAAASDRRPRLGPAGHQMVEVGPDPVRAVPLAAGGGLGVFGGAGLEEVGVFDP